LRTAEHPILHALQRESNADVGGEGDDAAAKH
jgi:hypothetical protein